MEAQINERLARFAKERGDLNDRLDETKAQISEWIATVQGEGRPDIGELAALEGLLVTRRNYLTEMIKLDDAYVDYLLALRAEPQGGDTSDAARDLGDR